MAKARDLANLGSNTGAVVTETSTDTLTNKTISGASNTLSAIDQASVTNLTTDLSAKASATDLSNHTGASTGVHGATGSVVGTSDTQTLTNKTVDKAVMISPEERFTVSATAATGTVNFDAVTQGVLYYTSNASANFTLNIRGNSSTTLNSMLAVGDAITLVFLNTNGATAYYPNVIQVDGTTVTPKWQGGTAPSGGNASAIDSYSITVIKTAATPTYTVLASVVKFA